MAVTPHDATRFDPWTAGFGGLLILLWTFVLLALFSPEAANGHGLRHASFEKMDQGGDGSARHQDLLWIGYALGSVMIAFFTGLLAWGTTAQHGKFGSVVGVSGSSGNVLRGGLFFAGGLLFEFVFAAMCYSYRETLINPFASFSGPFPDGLDWLIFGIWLCPAFFIVLYVMFFFRWVYPPEHAQKFEAVKAEFAVEDGVQAE